MTDHEAGPAPEPAPAPSTEMVSPADGTAPAADMEVPRKSARHRFSKRRVVVPCVVIVLGTMIMVGTGGNAARIVGITWFGPASKAEDAVKAPEADPAVGKSVRDGKFAFSVNSLQLPTTTLVDRSGTTVTAEGVFVIVRVNVTNIGAEARRLTATDQFLVNDKGQRFATSSAISSMKGAETIFLQKVNPGHTVNYVPLLFDVPAGTVVASIELHDSLSSTGVKVKLP